MPSPPTSAPTADVYELLRQYLSYLDGRTANVPNLVANIQKSGGNSFTFTDNKGLVSAPITLGEIDYDPTYVGVASVINVPDTAWQQPAGGGAYSVEIRAAEHGQMQDGVTAHDLWVTFDKTADNVISGAYQGYTVSESGDITLTATTPVNMTVRVWNGKGLIDQTAREDLAAETARATAEEARLQSEITAETARAETAESGLQSQIDEIVQSGVDLTARAQIAAETAAREAADATLQSEIDANKSDIQDNRDDIVDINAKIPSAATTANQLADKAFVNSSINALAAFYIEPTAAGDEAFATKAALTSATTFYSGGQPRIPTQNDYAIVLSDESQPQNADGTYPTTRYSWQGGTYPTGQWDFQYIVNNTPLTQAQVDAINSGITAQKIASMDAATAAKYTKPSSGIPESDLSSAVQSKLNTVGGVTGVKGNAETAYRTGNVNLTPANIGAVNKAGGDTMTGNLVIERTTGDTYYYAKRTDTGNQICFGIGTSGVNRGVFDSTLSKWIFHTDGKNVYVDGEIVYSPSNPPIIGSAKLNISSTSTTSYYLPSLDIGVTQYAIVQNDNVAQRTVRLPRTGTYNYACLSGTYGEAATNVSNEPIISLSGDNAICCLVIYTRVS